MDQAQKDYFYGRNFTLKGRIFYPQILQPKLDQRSGRSKYSVLFAWPINDASQAQNIQEIGKFLAEAKQRFFANVPDQHFGKPIKKWGEYMRRDGKPVQQFLEGMYWINMNASEKFPPTVVDQGKQQVIDPAQVWSGRNALVNFNFYSYSGDGVGITTGLSAVMLLEGGEREAGAGSVDVNQAFGQFANEMGIQAQPVQQPVQQAYQPPQPQAQPVQQQPVQEPVQKEWTPGQPTNNSFV